MRLRTAVVGSLSAAGGLALVAGTSLPPTPVGPTRPAPFATHSTLPELEREIEQAGPREREALASRLAQSGDKVGKAVLAAYPRMQAAGRLRAIRLLYDHDRPALEAAWERVLKDPHPQVLALALDLLAESGTPAAEALFMHHRPSSPAWLEDQWHRCHARLLARRKP